MLFNILLQKFAYYIHYINKNQIPSEADDELTAKFVIRNLQSAISYLNILVN